ncbi:methyltransferase domain-containing protein (plasmid) [Aquamicrobium terrae]
MAKQVLLIQGAGEGAHMDDAKLAESLRSKLGQNYQVRYPAMPDEADADYEVWKSVIQQEVEDMGERAVLVGHSIGASVLIRMFADRCPKPTIAGMFLIAGPFWHDHEFWRWDEAALPEDYPGDVPLFLYHGENDEFVPVSHLDIYAKALPQATVRRLPGRNHQLNDDMTEVARDIEGLNRMEPRNVLEGYARDAPHLVQSFEETSASGVYAHVTHLLPARFVDVGAGTGRDAAWFAAQGHSVLAVEPTDYLRAAGMELHPSPRIIWLSDTLPDLERTLARGEVFDRVIVCAVWQHLRAEERARAMPNLARLLAQEGLLIMILRHEPDEPRGRGGDTQREDAQMLARASGLSPAFAYEGEPLHPNRTRGVTLTCLAFAAATASPRGSRSF